MSESTKEARQPEGCAPMTGSPPADAPETLAAWENFDQDGKIVPFLKHAIRMERERNAMREWILQAAPMLSVAACIVIDEAAKRLDEIAGCRGVLELCPVEFIQNDQVEGPPTQKSTEA